MKACESCDRVAIASGFQHASPARTLFGLLFIYGPILFLPFVLAAGATVYLHLRIMGARNLRSLGSFLPDRASHRYEYKSQIVKRGASPLAFWARTRGYWIFNCSWYCPFSVASLEWCTYLVKVVENWWCPFAHAKKDAYAVAAIDGSYWHNPEDVVQLAAADRDNAIWNLEAAERAQRLAEAVPPRRRTAAAARAQPLARP